MRISGFDRITALEGGTRGVDALNGAVHLHNLDLAAEETPRPSQLYRLEAEDACLRRPVLVSHPDGTMLDVLLPHFIASSSCMTSDSTAHSRSCGSDQHDREDELAGFGAFDRMLEYLGLGRAGDVMTMTSGAPPVDRGDARHAGYVRKQ